MPVDRSYVAENDAERERLRALGRRLSDQDLARPMAGGWTVAGVLAHVAFWDQRIVVLLDEWVRRGPSWTPPRGRRDVDWINDAAKARRLALPPRVAAELAVSVAETVRSASRRCERRDHRGRTLGRPVLNWRRGRPRREHLDEIDEALRPGPGLRSWPGSCSARHRRTTGRRPALPTPGRRRRGSAPMGPDREGTLCRLPSAERSAGRGRRRAAAGPRRRPRTGRPRPRRGRGSSCRRTPRWQRAAQGRRASRILCARLAACGR